MNETVPGFGSVALFAALSALVLWIAYKNGFFRPLNTENWKTDLKLWQVLLVFAIYFGVSLYLAPLVLPFLMSILPTPSHMHLISWLSILLSTTILIGFLLVLSKLPKYVRASIWKNPAVSPAYQDDLKLAAITWCVSFPVVVCVSQFLDALVFSLFNITQLPDQIAVYFVKMTFAEPFYFLLAIVTIVILAPLIEELLFRGFLQSYIRKHLGSHQAIFITSLCFAFFHFSPEQGLGNIPIIGSLFSLALFLGYLYERQGTLFAPMALHALFNCISIFNLYFLGGAPRGAL